MPIDVGERKIFSLLVLILFVFVEKTSSQGLACYKCMTTNPNDARCADPFSSINNQIQVNCQATSMGKNGTFPARYCVKISGRILSIDGNLNQTFLNSQIYFRSCLFDNIMDSSKSLETTGNFRLKGFLDSDTSFRVQGSLSLCMFDGCNSAHSDRTARPAILLFCLIIFSSFYCRRRNVL